MFDRRALLSLGLAGAALAGPVVAAAPTLNEQSSGWLDGLRDPVIIREGATRHVFGSGGIFRDGGRDLIVYPAYDIAHDARPTRRLARLDWDRQGWPVVSA